VKNDIIWLKTAIKTMRAVSGFGFDLTVFDDAYEILWREKLIAKSTERERRPSREELWVLSRFFGQRKRSVPMLHIMWFAIYSARRLSEITRLEWTDNLLGIVDLRFHDLRHEATSRLFERKR
jgi:hypothetical protein